MPSQPQTRTTAPEYVTLGDVADLLGVSSRTVQRWTDDGLPCVELPSRGRVRTIRRYQTDAVRRWVDGHVHGEVPTPAAPEPAPAKRGRPRAAQGGGGGRD